VVTLKYHADVCRLATSPRCLRFISWTALLAKPVFALPAIVEQTENI